MSENRSDHGQIIGAWPEEAIDVKLGVVRRSIMRVKLVTGTGPEENSSNCPHQSKIKGLIEPLNPHGHVQLPVSSLCVGQCLSKEATHVYIDRARMMGS